MGRWCVVTGQPYTAWAELTIRERTAFYEEAIRFHKQKAGSN